MIRTRLQKLSVRWKIVLITVVTCAVVLGACTAVLVGSHLVLERAGTERQLTMLAEISALNVASAVLFDDRGAAVETLDSLRVVPGVVAAGILSNDDQQFVGIGVDDEQDAYAPPADHPEQGVVRTPAALTVFAPIRQGHDLLGTLYIHYDLAPVYSGVRHYAYMALGIVVAGLGAAILLSAQLQRLATDSLLRLNATIRKISARRDFSLRAQHQADDEVGELIDGFNQMLDLIQQRDTALQQHRENLEEEVRLRTEQLDSKNRRLQRETEQRRQLVEELRRRIEIEKLISSVSTQFLALTPDELGNAMDAALMRVGRLAGADLAFLATLSGDGVVTDFHEWASSNASVNSEFLGTRVAEELPWTVGKLQTGAPLLLTERSDISPEAEQERAFFAARNIHGLLCVPMICRGQLVGAVGMATVNRDREWSEEETHLVRLLGEIMLGTLERQWGEEERNRLEEQIRQAQKLESLGVLTGGIAHDFNNLLMGILGNAELAEEGAEDPEVAESLENIRTGAKQAADLCRQMLAYSGHGRVIMQTVHINHVLQQLADLLKTSISKKARMQLDLAEGLQPVRADISQIRQVAMNLITNAAEAVGDAEGTILVRTSMRYCTEDFLGRTYLAENLPAGDYVVLEVVDTGCGMDQQTLERIFDPFYTTKFTGRGLGLAAVLGIVRSHGAALDVASKPKQGTRFSVYLPVDPEPEIPTAAADDRATLDWRGQGTVLIAEDEPSVRFTIARMLKKLGLDVIEAEDGFEAVERMKKDHSKVQLLILDLNMPRMSGYEALCNIRGFDPDVPVLLSSGYSEEESTRDFSQLNLSGFIEKPYSVERLVAAVRDAFENPQKRAGEE